MHFTNQYASIRAMRYWIFLIQVLYCKNSLIFTYQLSRAYNFKFPERTGGSFLVLQSATIPISCKDFGIAYNKFLESSLASFDFTIGFNYGQNSEEFKERNKLLKIFLNLGISYRIYKSIWLGFFAGISGINIYSNVIRTLQRQNLSLNHQVRIGFEAGFRVRLLEIKIIRYTIRLGSYFTNNFLSNEASCFSYGIDTKIFFNSR